MRFTEIGCLIAAGRECPGKAARSNLGRQIDAIVMDPMGAAKLPGQDGGARGLTDHAGRDAICEMRALSSQRVEMRCLHLSARKAPAIGAVLIAGAAMMANDVLLVKRKKGSEPVAEIACRAFFSRLPPRMNAITKGRGDISIRRMA